MRESLTWNVRESCTQDVIEVSICFYFGTSFFVCQIKNMCCVLMLFVFSKLCIMLLLFLLDLYEKVVLGGAITKDSCSVPLHKNETLVPQSDPLLRLTSVVEEMRDSFEIQLQCQSDQLYIIQNNGIMDLVLVLIGLT